jgi:RNA polymerase sigma factor (sigma-70 family)
VQPQTPYSERRVSSSLAPSAVARLVSRAADGDQCAWDQLVERYSGLLWAVARAHRLASAEAADVLQTSWLRLVEHLAEIRNPDGIGAWLATTARRECLRALRANARCEPVEDLEELIEADPGELDAPLRLAERNAGLRAALERLPARDQALLRMLTADPAPSYEEIGAALAMPIGSIGPTRARALERLRRELRDAGLLDELATEARS